MILLGNVETHPRAATFIQTLKKERAMETLNTECSISIVVVDAVSMHLVFWLRWKEPHCASLKCWLREGDYGVALLSCWSLNEVSPIYLPALSVSVHFVRMVG